MFKIEFDNNVWSIEREENDLDKFVLKFIKVLEESKIDYVLVSGYVAILFGRSRNSEDIDLLLTKFSEDDFKRLWDKLHENNFECIITNDYKEAYEKYMLDRLSIRFSIKSVYLPNMEVKFPKEEVDEWTLKNPIQVNFNGIILKTSPLELQIPYKFYLGSEKDFEDALHLWELSKNHLNKELLIHWSRELKVERLMSEWLK